MTFNENDIAVSALSCATIIACYSLRNFVSLSHFSGETIFYESLAAGNAIIGDMHTAGIVELPIFNYLYI